MHSQQIVTANQILAVFLAKNYALMIAPMQSGKTGTFKLVGCEMLRQNMVDRVVIFSGNREEALKIQNKDNGSFMLSYKSYLQSQGHMVTDSEISGMIDKMTVVWGPQLKDFIPSGRILYIWEESHYGQTQKQQVDQFLTRVGIQSTGEAPEGCFVLSVSATPFSEFSDNSHLNQNKAIIRLVPPESYFGVEKMIHADQVHSYSNIKTQFKSVVKRGFRGYGLVRASGKLQAELIPIALAHGCQVIHYDQKNKEEELNAILSRPAVKTIVFIKGMCRMGHVVIKTHVSFAMETSKGKTDTILQGLLGRFCGYDSSGTHVYIKDLVIDELQRFVDMHNGVETTPVRGANLVGFTVKSRTAIIPIRVRRSDEADMANDILMALQDGRMENHNNNKYIEPVIRKICSAKMQPPEQMTEDEKVDADNFKFHADGVRRLAHREALRQEALNAIRHAFETKSRSFVLGPGYGASGKRDEVVVHQDRTYNYIIVYVPYDTEIVQVPHTTRREVFCRETSKPEYKGSGGFTCKIKESTRTDAKELEKTLNTCATFARNFGSDFEEYPNRITNNGTDCILLTEEVFSQLETIASKLRANGVILAWKKKGGRKPVGCDDVRLSEISWTFTATPSPTPSVLPKLKFKTESESKPKQLFVSEPKIKSVAEHLLSSQ